jgi:NifU-like protein involved in Fe-S cluster formation
MDGIMQAGQGTAVTEKRVTGNSGNPPGQGPFINITLRVVEGVVAEATYETYQCPGCIACGKALCELASGKRLEEVCMLNYPTLVERVGPLPPHRRICYGLALLALADALTQFRGNVTAQEN